VVFLPSRRAPGGYLREGDRLPTVKDVAADLVINPNTVVKAYRQLEHEGWPAAGRARARSSRPLPLGRRKRRKTYGPRWKRGCARPARPGSTMRR